MSLYTVQYSPAFREKLRIIGDYMADHGRSDASIERYMNTVLDTCEKFTTFPNRGRGQDHLLPGLRIWNIDGDTILAYGVDEVARTVTFIGITYGGQNWTEIFPDLPPSSGPSKH